jgi:arginine decarboxylase
LKTVENAPVREPAERWRTADAAELYDIAAWGKGYFSVGDNGHVLVHPDKNPARSIDLMELVEKLELRGIYLPILIRFAGHFEAPSGRTSPSLHARDQRSRLQRRIQPGVPDQGEPAAAGCRGSVPFRPPYGFGLEAGSKPELLAVMAIADNNTPIICNGFKDDEYIELAMLAKKVAGRSFR